MDHPIFLRAHAYICVAVGVLVAAMTALLPGRVCAATTLLVDSTFYSKFPYIRFVSSDEARVLAAGGSTASAGMQLTDEVFYSTAATIGFAVNKTEPLPDDQLLKELKNIVLPRINNDSLELVYMMIRGAASPDGPYENNKRLGEKRAKWLFDFIRQQLRFPVNEKLFRLDSEAEDYHALCYLMKQASDKDYAYVKGLCDTHLPAGNIAMLKTALQKAQGGQLWKRLNAVYFFHLRAARVTLYFKKYEAEHIEMEEITAPAVVVETPKEELPVVQEIPTIEVEPEPVVGWLDRRELLAVKTNLLFYGLYLPGYDRWCPIPNVALEYFPKKGHFTFGASFDMPWWQDYDAHKYFQLRNYQVETRYYFKADKPHNGYQPAFKGFYLSAYAHGGVFGICLDANRGWVGEGIGGGAGFGYVMPVSRNGHWRLDLGLQVGYFRCKYDPYQYGNPVDPTYKDGLYYYKWTLDANLFKERQYRWNWIGPTRVSVTLSYDLLYRRINKKGVSFKAYEANWANRANRANEANEANGANEANKPNEAHKPQGRKEVAYE